MQYALQFLFLVIGADATDEIAKCTCKMNL